jgi:hypothetical protein
MPHVRIGPARVADRTGTHEPGEEIDYPTSEMLALAVAQTIEPESGEPYCTVIIDPSAPVLPPVQAAADVQEPDPTPENV